MIELRNVCKQYRVGDAELSVLTGITLDVDAGEYVALMGASGSGKTTLMNLLGCLDQLTSGKYSLAGVDIAELSVDELAEFRNQHIGFVFQNFNLLPRTSALDNVLMPTVYAPRESPRARRERATQLLESVGLGDRLDHTSNQLSGGERQRVAIARALINGPKLLLADEPTGNLDSRTEQEILALFRQLNREQGITLVVVTHEAEVAEQAERVVHIKDGVISDDRRVDRSRLTQRGEIPLAEQADDDLPSQPAAQPASTMAGALNAVVTAANALRRNALRTVLTMLGVIIGVGSVVTVMELSAGASSAIEETVASMGASTITVTAGSGSKTARTRPVELTSEDVAAIEKHCPAVRVAAPIVYARAQLVFGNRNWIPKFVLGTSSDYLEARNWSEMDMGQSFSQRHIQEYAKVCVIGQTVAEKLFGSDYPIGKELRANGVPLRVLGVLAAKGADVVGADQDDIIMAPWTTLKFRINNTMAPPPMTARYSDKIPPFRLVSDRSPTTSRQIYQIYAQAHSPEHVAAAKQQIDRLLRQRHRIDRDDAIRVKDMTEVSNAMDKIVGGLSALGLVIGSVSLVVGGVGIMNIMLVSVTERTREIGLRMAVGANSRAILRQFLIEATVLCLIGGLVGIVIGHLLSMIVGAIIGWPTVMSIWAPIVAVTVSATVGILFGYYPARKASGLNPIDALRYE